MYGAYDTIDDRPALRFERRLAHPVDVVGGRQDWRALYEEYQRRGMPVGAPIPGE